MFQQRHVTPTPVVLLLRGIVKGEPSRVLAAELQMGERIVLDVRRAVQDRAEALQPDTPLPDAATESDEMFQNAGEKRARTLRSLRSTPLPGEQAAGARHL